MSIPSRLHTGPAVARLEARVRARHKREGEPLPGCCLPPFLGRPRCRGGDGDGDRLRRGGAPAQHEVHPVAVLPGGRHVEDHHAGNFEPARRPRAARHEADAARRRRVDGHGHAAGPQHGPRIEDKRVVLRARRARVRVCARRAGLCAPDGRALLVWELPCRRGRGESHFWLSSDRLCSSRSNTTQSRPARSVKATATP